METEEITIRVTSRAAQIYGSANAEQRAKLDLLISLKIGELQDSTKSIEDVIQDVRTQVTSNGLTQEAIQDLLR
jgi:hypothetical protein